MKPRFVIPPRLERPIVKAILRAPGPLLRRFAGAPIRSPEGLTLDLQLQVLLRMMKLTGEPELHEGSVEASRHRMDRSARLLDFDGVDGVAVTDRTVPGAAGPRPARLYRPKDGGRGGLVWFHGGGFALGSITSHDGVCRALAKRARVTVISVDYRLAPEHPFPAGVEDAITASRWILANAATLDLDPRAIAIGGDSAGGNLTAVTTLALKHDERRPAFQLLVYPGVDFTRQHASHDHFADGFILSRASIDWFIERYLPSSEHVRDPRASPLFAEDLSGLPPALVLTAGFDPLRDEGTRYAERLREAGNDVEHLSADRMLHGFFNMGGVVRSADAIIHRAAEKLRRALTR